MWGLALTMSVLAGAPAAQGVIDEVLLRFGSEIVTRLDVRQARMLKLVEPASDVDQVWVDALANRRLMLADLRRNAPPEPTTDAIESKFRDWTSKVVPPGGPLADVLARAGMSEAGVRGWMRDDLRIQTYINDRFGGRQADVAVWIAGLRQRAGIR